LSHWPQYLQLAMFFIAVGIALARFGEPKKPDTYDWIDVAGGPILSVVILYYGGWFAPLGWTP